LGHQNGDRRSQIRSPSETTPVARQQRSRHDVRVRFNLLLLDLDRGAA
jgi:hypothetical protein